MNEMSVFNGPEVTMHKSVTNLDGVEHREWHNLYGMYFQRATAEGLMLRDANKRPFVLSRSFYAGSQRWGAVWTGDNAAQWSHLKQAAPMLLSMSVCGLVFVGADAGGFFGDPDAELMARWIQAAAYTPFFRGHAHHDAKRREPWSFGQPTTSYIRRAIADRYALLPYWYSVFAESRFSGLPVMRPLWAEFPSDSSALLLDDQWMVGSALLVKPVTEQGAQHVDAYLPPGRWYEVHSAAPLTHDSRGQRVRAKAPIEGTAPLFQRAGTVVPRQRRLRRSTVAMATDPYELTVALDANGAAAGEVFLDDGVSFDFVRGGFARTAFSYANGKLSAAPAHECDARARALGVETDAATGAFAPANVVERIVVLGLPASPKAVAVAGRAVDFSWTAGALTIRRPDLPMAGAWEVDFSF